MAIVSRKIQSKIYIYKVAWLFNGNRSYAEYQVLAWVAIYPWFYCSWSPELKKWPAEPDSKAVNVMGREMTNIFICAFKVGSFETLLSGSFFNAGDWEQKNHE